MHAPLALLKNPSHIFGTCIPVVAGHFTSRLVVGLLILCDALLDAVSHTAVNPEEDADQLHSCMSVASLQRVSQTILKVRRGLGTLIIATPSLRSSRTQPI